MAIIAKNLVIGAPKEEPKNAPPAENSWNGIHYKLQQMDKETEREKRKAEKTAAQITRNVPFEEKVEEKSHYETIKHGDLEKLHNTKSHYLNDMTGFNN